VTTGRKIAARALLFYTKAVKSTTTPRINLCSIRRILALVVILYAVSGCASVWETPTPVPTSMPTPEEAEPSDSQPVNNPESWQVPPPVSTPEPVAFTISDEPLQYWSDPNDINGLIHDGDAVWAATYGGVVLWGADGSYRLYTVHDGLASQAVRGITRDGDGRIWVGYADHAGWSVFQDRRWHTYPTREAAVEEHYDALLRATEFDPRLWVRRSESTWLWLPTADGQLKAYDSNRWRTYGTGSGVTDGTWLVAISEAGRVWGAGRGISTAEEGEVYWDDHNYFSGVPEGSRVTGIAADNESAWISFAGPEPAGGGVGRYVYDAGRWEGYLHELSEAVPHQVHGIRIDDEGTIWLSGSGGLTYRRNDGPWRSIALGEVDVQCYSRDAQGTLWIGTTSGLWRSQNNGEELEGPWRVPSPMVGSDVTGLARDGRGRLFIATTRGVSYVSNAGDTETLTDQGALSLAVDRQGRVWLSTAEGLFRLEEDELVPVLDEPATHIYFDTANTAYLCTVEGRLLRLNGDSAEEVLNVRERMNAMPRDVAVDSEGSVWIATAEGLVRLAPDGTLEVTTEDNGLLSRDVRSVTLAAEDMVWVATASGLARLQLPDRWTRLTTESTGGGLGAMQTWTVRADDEGTLWVATAAGLSRRSAEADWTVFPLPEARDLLIDHVNGAIWVGTRGGLYRVRMDAFVPADQVGE
jgi:ligand-binding sensor domain-containing protein